MTAFVIATELLLYRDYNYSLTIEVWLFECVYSYMKYIILTEQSTMTTQTPVAIIATSTWLTTAQ